jgi:secreted PhoX family phosphatase
MLKNTIQLSLLSLSTVLFSSCFLLNKNFDREATVNRIKNITFSPLSVPETKEEQEALRISPTAKVNYKDGTVKKFSLNFQTVFRTDDKIGDVTVGTIVNKKGNPIIDRDGSYTSNRTDGMSIIEKEGSFFLLTHFETYPGAIYVTDLDKTLDGTLKAKNFRNIDFSPVNGTMINCAASVTPWNTHLSAEEDYYLDAAKFSASTKKYVNKDHIDFCEIDNKGKISNAKSQFCYVTKRMRDDYLNNPNEFTPYNYGYILEVEIDNQGNGKVRGNNKHYAMGKGTPEMAMVMPDNRTVYITDDGDYRGLYMFIADKEGDLSEGTLYMVAWEQTSAENDGQANLKWIKLGHGSDAEIKAIINKKPDFSDIFEVRDSKSCKDNGYKVIRAGDPEPMCLRLRDGRNGTTIASNVFKNGEEVQKAAAFLETRKYGVYLGATSEFRKEEGITYDPDRNVLYLAMSEINKSMLDNFQDKEPQNKIRLPQNDCGTVYELKLGSSDPDSDEKIDSKFIGKSMKGLISGKPLKTGEQYADRNSCHPDFIANPDNLQYIAKDLLLIDEDTSGHPNPDVWAYDTRKKSLTRIMTGPAGSEFSGMFTNIASDNSHYIFLNSQHPLNNPSENAEGELVNLDLIKAATPEQKRSYVGYISGLPALK